MMVATVIETCWW